MVRHARLRSALTLASLSLLTSLARARSRPRAYREAERGDRHRRQRRRCRRLDIETAFGATLKDKPVEPTLTAMAPAARRSKIATLDEAVRLQIENVLAISEGQIEGPRGAARILDINPRPAAR